MSVEDINTPVGLGVEGKAEEEKPENKTEGEDSKKEEVSADIMEFLEGIAGENHFKATNTEITIKLMKAKLKGVGYLDDNGGWKISDEEEKKSKNAKKDIMGWALDEVMEETNASELE